MPTAVENPASQPVLAHKLWTRDECERLVSAGLLDGDRYELLGGELILKMPKNLPHITTLSDLIGWLNSVFGQKYVLQEPTVDLSPEDLPTSAPEPDAVVLRRPTRSLESRPGPADILFVAEVSNTTLEYDLTAKARLYARSGIEEYWVLDVVAKRVIVHRVPEAGHYGEVFAYGVGESLAPLAAPDRAISVRDLF